MIPQTVRLPDDITARLEDLAQATKRTKSSIILEAIENHLDECEELELALSRFRDPDAEWVDHEDVRRELGLD